jgi:uncharacterized protein
MKKLGIDKLINIAFIVLVIAMIIAWKPWESSDDQKRTISGQGTAVVESEPDQYVFMPTYDVVSKDPKAIYDQLAQKSSEIVATLKEQGVPEKDIKVDASSYDYWRYYTGPVEQEQTGSVVITIKADDKTKAEKIQTILATTSAKGQLTPAATFSQNKSEELKKQARKMAITKAKADAEETADELGKKMGDVISINDNGAAYPMPYYDAYKSSALGSESVQSTIPILPGQNEYTYNVTVVYELK